MEQDKTIKTVYEMMYPYGDYNYDPAFSCIAINRELRKLCRENMRHVLLIIARYLEFKFDQIDTTEYICGKIQNKIMETCLSYDLSDEDRAKFIIGTKTGIVGTGNDDDANCSYFKRYNKYSDSILLSLYNITGITIFKHIISYKKYGNNVIEYFFMSKQEQIYFERGELKEVFRMGINIINDGDRKQMIYDRNRGQYFINNQSQLNTFYKIMGAISDGKLDVYATWDDACSYLSRN